MLEQNQLARLIRTGNKLAFRRRGWLVQLGSEIIPNSLNGFGSVHSKIGCQCVGNMPCRIGKNDAPCPFLRDAPGSFVDSCLDAAPEALLSDPDTEHLGGVCVT